jgi:hypothetical protein
MVDVAQRSPRNQKVSSAAFLGNEEIFIRTDASVTVRLRPGLSGMPLVKVAGWQRDIVVGNMTLDGDGSRATWGIEVNSHDGAATCTVTNCRFGNLVVHHTSQGGIRVAAVNSELHIVNNTIAYCPKGIAVDSVKTDAMWGGGGEMFPRNGQKKYYNVSAVENNIVYEYTHYGIKIGQSTGTNEQQAQAWNPLADNHPYGEPNPIVPVKYNCVWNSTGQGTPFEGTQWYRSGYGSPSNRVHGETSQNPLLDENNGYLPAVESNGEGSYQRLNNISPTNDPILGKGNPYKIDTVKSDGNYYGMRRSMGAYEVRDTSLSLEDYYWAQLD